MVLYVYSHSKVKPCDSTLHWQPKWSWVSLQGDLTIVLINRLAWYTCMLQTVNLTVSIDSSNTIPPLSCEQSLAPLLLQLITCWWCSFSMLLIMLYDHNAPHTFALYHNTCIMLYFSCYDYCSTCTIPPNICFTFALYLAVTLHNHTETSNRTYLKVTIICRYIFLWLWLTLCFASATIYT